MLNDGALNPYKSPLNNVAKFYARSQCCDTYNTKVKHYPDGTQNICFARSDIFGRSEQNFQYNRQFWSDFKEKTNLYHVNTDLAFQQYERFQVVKQIEVYFKSVDNFLLFTQQAKKFDSVTTHDILVNGGNSLDLAERDFVNSLRNSIRTDNLKKTREQIFDYVMCNEWDYFFTGTIDPKKYDSKNAYKIKKPLKKWFNHMQERYGLSYIVIFEYHKKGGIHIHGLIRSNPLTPLKLVLSDTKIYYGFKKPMKDKTALKHGLDISKGKPVYNLKTWRFGWSTAIKVYGSQAQISNYITKYITKSNEKIMGRYFWHSHDLAKPNVFFMNTSYDDLPLPTYHGFKYLYNQASNELYEQFITISDIDKQDNKEENNENNDFMSGWVDL